MADAVSILPAEIWEFILTHVQEEPNDALSCYQTCTLWNSTLEKSRTSWLFPSIYPYLHKQLEWNIKDVMSCRLVCQSWTKRIDTYMESRRYYPLSFPPNPSWLITQHMQSVSSRENPYIPKNCETFINDFKDSSERNPFISRTLQLTSCLTAGSKTVHFLRLFGCHLRALKLKISDLVVVNQNLAMVLEHLWDILECVPFLQHFELVGRYNVRWWETDDYIQKFLQSRHNPPPKLAHLAFVDLIYVKCPQLVKIFIQKFQSPQVTILYNYYNDIEHVIFSSNMRTLFLSWDTEASSFQSLIHALSHINCPLESVDIRVQSFPNVDQLFHQILKFKQSLCSLTLIFEKYRTETLVLPTSTGTNCWASSSANTQYFSYISQLQKLNNLEIMFKLNSASSPTEADLQILAQSVLIEHWPDYREAGEKGRRLEIKTFSNLWVRLTVSLLRKGKRVV